ncbi:MAG: dienelactone hydrolase family protein, partial [Sphingomicrobium sp.]
RQQAINLYDRFTHGGMDRRDFMARMTAIAGTGAAASALIASIAADPAAATVVDATDARLITSKGPLTGSSKFSGYVAARKGVKKAGVVMVVHENRGLTPHIEDIARRIALEGFIAVAPDMLSSMGGTPADENAARDMIGKLDLSATVASATMLSEDLKKLRHSNRKLGIIGFCWGGAFVNRFAVADGAKLNAGVAYYGPAPDPAEAVKVKAPLLLHYAGLDTRVAQTGETWVAALKAAGKDVTSYTYQGVNHAFNNDTSAERYNKAAADLAWQRTIAFFKRNLS